jgi:hypothetical protein
MSATATPATPPSADTDRLDAMICNGWKIEKSGPLFRVRNLTTWMDDPRATIDKAIEIKSIQSKPTRRQRPDPLADDDIKWVRWETIIFPAETVRADIIKSAKRSGWNVSIVRVRKSGEWKAMAMTPTTPITETA